MNRMFAAFIATTLAMPVFAEGDIAAGEKAYGKCKSCHMIVDDEDNTIMKGGRTGPNLYGVIGRQAGSVDFKFGDDLVAAGEAGLVWDEENFAEYVVDPKKFLAETLDNKKARSKMTFKLKKGGEDVAAYLASLVPAAE